MSGSPAEYWGKGFSPRGDKNRFVLPPDFRNTVKDASGGDRVLCLDKHQELPCLVGFGLSRAQQFIDLVAEEKASKAAAGVPFNAELMLLKFGGFERVNFDESGRFILPEFLAEAAEVKDGLYFQGSGVHVTIWAPEVLFAMDSNWDIVKANCRSRMAEAALRGKRK